MAVQQRIFLGHASEDKQQVRELYHQLKAKGLSPWLDDVDLMPGQFWRIEIPKAIKSAAVFLACLSKTSVAKRSYVQKEFRYALSVLAEIPQESIYLIPVRLDDCQVPDLSLPELELKLTDIQRVDLFEPKGVDRLIEVLKKNLGETSAIETATKAPQTFEMPWVPEMIAIPTGSFVMGSTADDAERPQRKVTINEPFAMGRFPVTFNEYDHFCNETHRERPADQGWGRGRLPVINVSFADAEAYCAWLSGKMNARFRLPSEAEWEYACRAGTDTAYSFGDELTMEQANFGQFVDTGSTTKVGRFPANAWDLHDMHGNVWEWCADHWHETYEGAPLDGSPWLNGKTRERVLRGGSWNGTPWVARSAHRAASVWEDRDHCFGFRCVQVQETLGRSC